MNESAHDRLRAVPLEPARPGGVAPRALRALLCAVALVSGAAASATTLSPEWALAAAIRAHQPLPNRHTRHADFGVLADLAGSCWKVDTRPAVEVCYGFDATGRQLNARQFHGGRLQAESSVVASVQPGWLLETSRSVAHPYTSSHHLRVEASSGLIFRVPVRPAHYQHRGEVERSEARFVSETIRRLDADRFELVQRSGSAEGYGPPRPHDLKVVRWTFTRARPGAEIPLPMF